MEHEDDIIRQARPGALPLALKRVKWASDVIREHQQPLSSSSSHCMVVD